MLFDNGSRAYNNAVTVERFRLPHAQLCLRDRCLLTAMRVAKVNDQSGYIEMATREYYN